jgi:hypothetical protein
MISICVISSNNSSNNINEQTNELNFDSLQQSPENFDIQVSVVGAFKSPKTLKFSEDNSSVNDIEPLKKQESLKHLEELNEEEFLKSYHDDDFLKTVNDDVPELEFETDPNSSIDTKDELNQKFYTLQKHVQDQFKENFSDFIHNSNGKKQKH